MRTSLTVTSWNINSIRARLPLLLNWLKENHVDILLLQELKCLDEQFPREELEDLGYHVATHGQKSYNGVAICSRWPLEDIEFGFPHNPKAQDARAIRAYAMGPNIAIQLINLYIPNGQEVGSEKFHYKLDFLASITPWLYHHAQQPEPLIVSGDFNVAPTDIDVHNPRLLEQSLCCHSDERQWLRQWEYSGLLHDAFRLCHPNERQFTWWDYRSGDFVANRGLRIDHHFISNKLADRLIDVTIDKNVRSQEKSSDHAPISCHFQFSSSFL
jgi:exodeoxyribonuclease III